MAGCFHDLLKHPDTQGNETFPLPGRSGRTAKDPGGVNAGKAEAQAEARRAGLLLDEGKITEEVVANIRSWKHSGFSVDQSVRLEAGDQEGVERLMQYFLRCPFSGGKGPKRNRRHRRGA